MILTCLQPNKFYLKPSLNNRSMGLLHYFRVEKSRQFFTPGLKLFGNGIHPRFFGDLFPAPAFPPTAFFVINALPVDDNFVLKCIRLLRLLIPVGAVDFHGAEFFSKGIVAKTLFTSLLST